MSEQEKEDLQNSVDEIDHSIHAVISHAKKNLKQLHENQTELDKTNLEYQGVKDQLSLLLEVAPEELTPQEFSNLISLIKQSEEIMQSKSSKKEEK